MFRNRPYQNHKTENLIRLFNQQRYISTKIIESALSNCCASVITDSWKTDTQPGQAEIEDLWYSIYFISPLSSKKQDSDY